MKCQYCGSNLGIENEICPYCGRENTKAIKYLTTKQGYQNELTETQQKVKKKVKISSRSGRLIIIALMVAIVAIMATISKQLDDVSTRIERREDKLEQDVDKNIDKIALKLSEMESDREYLAMSYYILNYHLMIRDEFKDYTRVFTAVTSYQGVFEDILNIATGFDFYGQYEISDWCKSIAHTIATWNKYVEGEFWSDKPDSPMHSGEHGAFLADIKAEVHDIVQVYFHLNDAQADAMWTMEEEELLDFLYKQYISIYPEVRADE